MSKDFRFNKFDMSSNDNEGDIIVSPKHKKTARRRASRITNDYALQRRVKKERGNASELF